MSTADEEQENRRRVLREWLDANGGHARVVASIGLTQGQASYLSQVCNGYSFAARAARNMEARLRLSDRYLERLNDAENLPMAHGLSQPVTTVHAQQVRWESLVNGDQLGEIFRMSLPDDAIEPGFTRGTEIMWSTVKPPAPGSVIVIRDVHQQCHVRIFHRGKAPGQWQAVATNPAYPSFDSENDTPLTIIAVGAFRPMP